ncbi:hypothetical protein GGR54DRAFT_617156 [Hypoxylon sp. NC1633]|nr:hypothetical protein GGR54DRAFT_617156 [Hypoxylon sp. NC1633]
MILYRLLTRDLGEKLLPTAMALYYAKSADWAANPAILKEGKPGCRYTLKVQEFCQTHMSSLYSPFTKWATVTLPLAIDVMHFYHVAEGFAPYIDDEMIAEERAPDAPPTATRTEKKRFIQSVYMCELARVLIPYRISRKKDQEAVYRQFWRSFAPWEVTRAQPSFLSRSY